MSKQPKDGRFTIQEAGSGVTAAGGFLAAGVHCGVKYKSLDLALIVCERAANVAAVFTTNKATAAPVQLGREYLERSGGRVRAIAINSGCANACTGAPGLEAARKMSEVLAHAVECPIEQALVSSTGVIGLALELDKISTGIVLATSRLARHTHQLAARAILTTDAGPKEHALRVATAEGTFCVGGMAKGSGMIEPNMATMLAFLTTDAQVSRELLQRALGEATDATFNMITVDGECSTNDSVFIMASGKSGVTIDSATYPAFAEALRQVCSYLAREIVRGGEGATKLVTVKVTGATSVDDARRVARAIANSLLVKTAISGGDPNWGRLLAVAGRSGAAFDLSRARVRIGDVVLYAEEQVHPDLEPAAAEHLRRKEVEVGVDLGTGGEHQATMWTCDLSEEYVRINADYRT